MCRRAMGLIIRTAGAEAHQDAEIKRDYEYLLRHVGSRCVT